MEESRFRFAFSLGGKDTYLYGYRPSEVGLPMDMIPDQTYRIKTIHRDFYNNDRGIVRTSLGCHIDGVACPVPDLNHAPSQVIGAVKRVAAAMPQINRVTYRRFKRFVKRFLHNNCRDWIFDASESFDFHEWIVGAPYTQARKDELSRCYEKAQTMPKRSKKLTEVKAFVKDEDYEDYKHVRGIYSRSDFYKTLVGPFFKKFGDRMFSSKWFIKKIPVPDRPSAIMDKLSGYAKIFCTDFSQYEATFVRQLMQIELMVYDYVLQNHPMKKELHDLILKGCMGNNHIEFKNWIFTVNCKRMSGEMNTSCGNGIMNLLITFFVLEEAGNKNYDSYFEGDDSINGCDFLPTEQQYADLGANIKIDVPESLSTASFCGNVFDEEIKHNVTNPMEASVRFGWTTRKYLRSGKATKMKLLKAKAMSMIYEYPACPILRALGNYAYRTSKDYELDEKFIKNNFDSYRAETMMQAMDDFDDKVKIDIHPKTRNLVERLYGIDVKTQLKVESYLDSLSSLQPLEIELNYPKVWKRFYSTYKVENDSPADIRFTMGGGHRTRCPLDAIRDFIIVQ